MENVEEKKARIELDRINSIQPDDNLKFLINQISIDNIEVTDKSRVLNILNEVKLGITALTEKLNQERSKNKKQK